jgi:hypothetical protein
MPQPPIEIVKYLATPLVPLREQYPPGTGGTGARSEWPEGTLKGIEEIEGFQEQVLGCESKRSGRLWSMQGRSKGRME